MEKKIVAAISFSFRKSHCARQIMSQSALLHLQSSAFLSTLTSQHIYHLQRFIKAPWVALTLIPISGDFKHASPYATLPTFIQMPHSDDSDNLTVHTTDNLNLGLENAALSRTICWCANNKPWVTPELKALLNEKKEVLVIQRLPSPPSGIGINFEGE